MYSWLEYLSMFSSGTIYGAIFFQAQIVLMRFSSGQIALVCFQIERLFQYSREELLGRSIEILVPETAHEKHPVIGKAFPVNRKQGLWEWRGTQSRN